MSISNFANILVATFLLQSIPTFAQEIEIKEIRLGMTQAEVEKKVGQLPLQNFTIAGVPSKYSTVSVEFHEGKVDSFRFFFNSQDFNDVLGAVQKKYPKLKCENSSVKNSIGMSFTNTDCVLREPLGSLQLSRFVNDISTSVLSLVSDRRIKEFTEKKLEHQKDL